MSLFGDSTSLFPDTGLSELEVQLDAEPSPPAVSTPMATSAGGSGEFLGIGAGGVDDDEAEEGSTEPVIFGVSIAHVQHPKLLCLACIGDSGTKFCAAAATECSIASHGVSRNKAIGIKPGLYIIANSVRTGRGLLTNPWVDKDQVNGDVISDTLQRAFTLEEARTHLSLINTQGVQTLDDKEEAELQKKKSDFDMKTPMKSRSSAFASGLAGDSDELADKWSDMEMMLNMIRGSNLDASEVMDDQNLAREFARLDKQVGLIRPFIAEICNQVDLLGFAGSDPSGVLESVRIKVGQIEAVIGHQNNALQNSKMEPVIWDAIANVHSVAADCKANIKQIPTLLSDGQKRLVTDLRKVLDSYKKMIEGLRLQVKNLANKSGGSGAGPQVSFGGLNLGGGNNTAPVNPTPAQVPQVVLDRISDLELFVQGLNKGVSESVRINNVTFGSVDDVELWMMKNGPPGNGVPRHGLFVDPLILFHWVYTKLSGSSTTPSELTARKKLDLNELELRSLESYGTDVPFILSGKQGLLDSTVTGLDKSRLNNIKSYKEWENPGLQTGLRQRIEATLLQVKSSLSQMIDREFRSYPFVAGLAKEMLVISHSFILSLNHYISETYTNFSAMNIGSGKEIWALVTFVVEELFKRDFSKKRESSIGSLDPESRLSGFTAMWCAIQSAGLAKHLDTVGIKDTPSVSASYVRFVLTQSNMGKVGALVEENNNLKRKLETQQDELTAVKKLATDAKRLADSAISKINNSNGGGRGGGRGGGGGARADNP